MKNTKGFTLIELIIVIAIIAILAGAIFVAIDPARRLHESRNARRVNDISAILDAVKTYQADSSGDLPTTLAAVTNNLFYQIGTGASGCNITCLGSTTQLPCVDLSIIGTNYLAKVPVDPSEGEDGATGYGISKDSNGAIMVIGCYAEGEGPGGMGAVPDLRVTR